MLKPFSKYLYYYFASVFKIILFYQKNQKMKKVLFTLLLGAMCIATGMMISCDSKKESKKLGSYEITEKDGKVGLKDSTGHEVLSAEYDKVEQQFDAVIAEREDLSTIVVGSSVIASGIQIESIDQVEGNPDYAYIRADGRKMLWKKGSSSTYGPFDDICLIDNVIFMKADNKWGAATLDFRGLAPRQYEKVIIVKNERTMAVLVKDAKGWAMFDGDGVSNGNRYDISPKALEKQVKALNVDGDIAVCSVNWKL